MGKMDRKTLAGLTDQRRLSRLSPHARLIRELRRSGVTFGGIARLLSEKKHVTVDPSTVFYFLKRLEREAAKSKKTKPRREKPREQAATPPAPAAQAAPPPAARGARSDDAWQRINALKQRQPSQAPAEKVFHFDEDEPLTLAPEKKGT
jgi:IS30 family transposase